MHSALSFLLKKAAIKIAKGAVASNSNKNDINCRCPKCGEVYDQWVRAKKGHPLQCSKGHTWIYKG